MRRTVSFALGSVVTLVSCLVGCSRKSEGTDASAAPVASSRADASVATPDTSPRTSPRAPVSAASAAVPPVTDVMSGASTSWAGGPKVVTTGAVDGEALRRRTRERLAKDSSKVTMLQGGSARELGTRLCEAVVPSRPKDTPILIKPNLGGFEWFKDPAKNDGDDGVKGRITDPEFVRGIVRCLKARGHDKITVAEGWGAKHADWEKLVKVSGYAAMAREEKVRLVAMDDDGVFDKEDDQPGKPLAVSGMEKTHAPTLLMPKILAEHLEHGLFISAPKIKAHRFGVASISIKGGQGVVMLSDASPAYKQKWRMHKELGDALGLLKTDKAAGQKAYVEALEVFAERMSDVLELAAPHVVLAEGAPAEAGDGFAKRWPSSESVAIGGLNPITVDRVAAAFLGLWDNADLARELGGHKTSPLIETAAKRFGIDLSSPVVEGDGAELLAKPRPVHFVSMSGFALHSDDSKPESSPGSGASGAGTTNERPTMTAPMVDDTTVTVDGIEDSAWKRATPVAFDTDWSGTKTDVSTRVRAMWSKHALYMLWELEGAGLAVDASRPVGTEREKLYEEDCVELFLGPDASERTRYYEVEVGPLGHFFDLSVNRKTKKSDVAWSSDPKIVTKVDREHHRATIEFALRSPDVVSALAKGKKLPLALYRMEGKGKRFYLAWSPTNTPKPNFHVPDAFGTLSLE